MAGNVRWILEAEPPGSKMLLWAHNFHVGDLRRAYATAHSAHAAPVTMGGHLREMFGADYLAVGLLFDAGSFRARGATRGSTEPGPFTTHALGPGPCGSIGAAFVRAGLPAAILDLRAIPPCGPVHDWWSRPHRWRDVGSLFRGDENADTTGILPEVFDVVIFINNTAPSRPWTSATTP